MNRPTLKAEIGNQTHPPKVPLAIRIGIVGHRPYRLTNADHNALGNQISTLIKAIQDEILQIHAADRTETGFQLYNRDQPFVVALSPLAEGVDQIFAERANDAGCELAAVLPFPQPELEKDFDPSARADQTTPPDPHSLDRFRKLLGCAKTVFQLDGSRTDEQRAYYAAGATVLNQSDVLFVVWDGVRTEHRGGTEDTFNDAVQRGVTVIWIDAHAPHHWRTVTQPIRQLDEMKSGERVALVRSQPIADLQAQVRKLIEFLQPPASDDRSRHHSEGLDAKPIQAIKSYYSETQPKYHLAIWWKLFRDAVGDFKFTRPNLVVTPYEEAVQRDWPRDHSTPVSEKLDWLRPFFAWSDKLADRYADFYRSAFVAVFMAAALSVGMALAAIGFGLPEDNSIWESVFALCELVAIVGMMSVVYFGRRGEWHRRWLDYRLLAEIIRHQRLIVFLGGERATPKVPEHWTGYGDLGTTWMAWYARAVERAMGLPEAVVGPAYLNSCLVHLKDQLDGPEGQISFHKITSARSERIEHRLHLCEKRFLQATIISCCLHLAHIIEHDFPNQFSHWFIIPSHPLTFFCGFFPAVVAALAGINNQGEFRRIALRSKSMSERLEHQLQQVRHLQQRLERPDSADRQLSMEITSLSSDIARTMVSEILDWRVIFQDQPLKTG